MKSYEEITRNVLRRRDEQIAKKRRKTAVIGSALPVAAVSLAVVAGVAALQGRTLTEGGAGSSAADDGVYIVTEDTEGLPYETMLSFLCGTKQIDYTNIYDVNVITLDESERKSPAELINGRLIFTADGQYTDITDLIDEKTPYIYEGTNPQNGLPDIIIVGGTTEDYGWVEQLMYEECSERPETSFWAIVGDWSHVFAGIGGNGSIIEREWYGSAIDELRQNARYTGIIASDRNSVVAEDTLDGYTAALALLGITHFPTENEDYYSAEEAIVTVTDPDGNMSWSSVKVNAMAASRRYLEHLDGTHANESVKLMSMFYEWETHYVLALRSYTDMSLDPVPVPVSPDYCTMFFAAEPYCFKSGNLELYKCDVHTSYELKTTDNLGNKNKNVFVDFDDEYFHAKMTFDPDHYTFTYDSFSQEVLMNKAEVAAADMDGYNAHFELQCVTHIPAGKEDYYAAEGAKLTVTDPDGRTASVLLNAASDCLYYHFFYDGLNGTHADESLKIYDIEYDGEPHYVLALRRYFSDYPDGVQGYGSKEETEKYVLIFFALEEECFEDGQLRIYESGMLSDPSPNYIVFAGEELETEGNALIDNRVEISKVHFYEFDPENYFYDWRYEDKD